MTTMKKILAGGAGLAALAAAAPATAQYYGYSNPYGYAYGQQAYGMNTNVAAQQCSAAVQNRLYTRTGGVSSILGAILGQVPASNARVLSITQARPLANGTIRVRGLATSGRYAVNSYGPYGIGAYGALGYAYQPDLRFKCDVDFRGYVRDVDIRRR